MLFVPEHFFNPVLSGPGQCDMILTLNHETERLVSLATSIRDGTLWRIKATRPLRNVRVLEDQLFASWLIFSMVRKSIADLLGVKDRNHPVTDDPSLC